MRPWSDLRAQSDPTTKGLYSGHTLAASVNPSTKPEEDQMAWTAPKLKEVNCGMEINSYAPAEDEGREQERDLF
jgi:coenzyme PQQ precursor peptide PqqA